VAELRAYDPGDKYTGVAYFREPDGPRDPLSHDPTMLATGWACYRARVADPDEALDELARDLLVGKVLYVVYERFRLYGDKAQEQTRSEFLTAQSVGVIRWLVRNVNLTRAEQGQVPIRLEDYGAEEKTPARRILRAKGIRSTAKLQKAGPGDHAVDAELHGWHYVFDGLLNPQVGE
jgi:hypothetical protein